MNYTQHERLRQLHRLFDEARHTDQANRADFLLDACPDDEQLRKQVTKALDRYQAPKHLEQQSATPSFGTLTPEQLPHRYVGKKFKRYRIREFVQMDDLGTLYRAKDTNLGIQVCLKALREVRYTDSDFLATLKQKAAVLRDLQHPHILPFYTFRDDFSIPSLIAASVEGIGMQTYLEAQGPLPWREAVPLMTQLLEATAYAQEQGVHHPELMTADLILEEDEEGHPILLIQDYGLVKRPSADLMIYQDVEHSPLCYMAPEYLKDTPQVDARTDIYTVGIVCYEMLTGHLPFTSQNRPDALRKAIRSGSAVSISQRDIELPGALKHIIMKAISRNPDQRYQDADEMRHALEGLDLLEEAPVEETPVEVVTDKPDSLTSEPPVIDIIAPEHVRAQRAAPEGDGSIWTEVSTEKQAAFNEQEQHRKQEASAPIPQPIAVATESSVKPDVDAVLVVTPSSQRQVTPTMRPPATPPPEPKRNRRPALWLLLPLLALVLTALGFFLGRLFSDTTPASPAAPAQADIRTQPQTTTNTDNPPAAAVLPQATAPDIEEVQPEVQPEAQPLTETAVPPVQETESPAASTPEDNPSNVDLQSVPEQAVPTQEDEQTDLAPAPTAEEAAPPLEPEATSPDPPVTEPETTTPEPLDTPPASAASSGETQTTPQTETPAPQPQTQPETPSLDLSEIYTQPDQMPRLAGGDAAIANRIRYPSIARRARIQGTVRVRFVVDENGNVRNPIVVKPLMDALDKEALRVIQGLKFQPGLIDNTPVKVMVMKTIDFRL